VHEGVALAAQGGDAGGEGGERGGIVHRGGLVVAAREQPGQRLLLQFAPRHGAAHRFGDMGAEGLAVHGAARRAQQPQRSWQQAVALQRIERGQQHALGKIAGGAEEHEEGGVLGHRKQGAGHRRYRGPPA
jgi:hypothetical protein